MKKVLLVAMCVLTLFCLCACSGGVYGKMNKVLSANHAEIEISVETTKGNDKLTSSINIINLNGVSTINYHVEKFTEISADKIPSSYKTVYEGVVTVSGGNVIAQTGDELKDVSFADATTVKYNFGKGYFADEQDEDGVFKAKVLFPIEFAGENVAGCTDMTVEFNYTAEVKVLTVSYVASNGVSVKITYTMK